MKKKHQTEQTNHSALKTASNNIQMISLIHSNIKEKLTPSISTDTLVYVMYLGLHGGPDGNPEKMTTRKRWQRREKLPGSDEE